MMISCSNIICNYVFRLQLVSSLKDSNCMLHDMYILHMTSLLSYPCIDIMMEQTITEGDNSSEFRERNKEPCQTNTVISQKERKKERERKREREQDTINHTHYQC
jgi:hypothetical protein